MALMERVATLIRANLNDLIVQAEDPEKMLRQVIVDMQNQLRQVKTQVAIAITDQHLLAKKQKEHESQAAEWFRKAELAISKEQDELHTHGKLLVEDVSGPALAAGIEQGDVVLGVNGTGVGSVAELKREVARAGRRVALLIQRDDAQIYVPVDIG